ncbi:MAG: hypothetical protein WD625_00050, partial [Balneolales bacterium]
SLIVNMYNGSGVISYRGKVHSESLGVFTLNDGRLIHFSSQLDEGERRTLIEVFSSEGELEGVGRLEEFTFAGTEAGPLIGSFWKDEEDRFYFIDNQDVPIVRVGRIEGI